MNRRKVWRAALILAAAASTGCHFHKHGVRGGSIEPLGATPDGIIVGDAGTMAPRSGFVDRHPLLYKPRDVYHTTAHHAVIKAMAATVVGVPTGVVCEVGQVFNGCDRCLH